MKNKALKLFLAMLIIVSAARAADFEVLDFSTLSNPFHKMPAINRLEALHILSQNQPGIAEQCLNEIVLILHGKYGFSKRRADDGERRTVAKAMAAYTKFLPSKNPFEEQQTMCDVDESMSARIQHHFEVLKEGFEHIASLISDESDQDISVFGITIQLSELIGPKSAATSVASIQSPEPQEDVSGDGAFSVFDENSGLSSPHSVSSNDEGYVTGEDDMDMAGVMNALHRKKKDKSSNGVTPVAKVGSKPLSGHQRLKTDDGKKRRGRVSNRSGAAALGVPSGTNLRAVEVSDPKAEQQGFEAARIEEEQKKKKKEESDGAGGGLRVNETGAPELECSETASHDGASSSDSDDDQQRDCCSRRKSRKCLIC